MQDERLYSIKVEVSNLTKSEHDGLLRSIALLVKNEKLDASINERRILNEEALNKSKGYNTKKLTDELMIEMGFEMSTNCSPVIFSRGELQIFKENRFPDGSHGQVSSKSGD